MSNQDLRAEILASPYYREMLEPLFSIFKLSREMGIDAGRLLSLQAAVAKLLLDLQEDQRKFKKESNAIGVAVSKKLILLLKNIIDSVIWRTFNYDRITIQLLAEKQQTGFLDDTVYDDLEFANHVIKETGNIAIVNDLSTVSRHGDVTIIDRERNSVYIHENKREGSSKSGRAVR